MNFNPGLAVFIGISHEDDYVIGLEIGLIIIAVLITCKGWIKKAEAKPASAPSIIWAREWSLFLSNSLIYSILSNNTSYILNFPWFLAHDIWPNSHVHDKQPLHPVKLHRSNFEWASRIFSKFGNLREIMERALRLRNKRSARLSYNN